LLLHLSLKHHQAELLTFYLPVPNSVPKSSAAPAVTTFAPTAGPRASTASEALSAANVPGAGAAMLVMTGLPPESILISDALFQHCRLNRLRKVFHFHWTLRILPHHNSHRQQADGERQFSKRQMNGR
jgi:hypothetical protein